MADIVDFIMDFESGNASDDEIIENFQKMIDDGSAWNMQGCYGRMATALIEKGLCKKK
jgi:hypothetical protein